MDNDPANGDKPHRSDAAESGNEEEGKSPWRQEAGKGDSDDKKAKRGDEKPDRPSPLKKPWVRVALIVFLLLLLVAGGFWLYGWWSHGRFVEKTNDAYLQADQVVISAKVSGAVEEVFVVDNQEVHVGDPLVRIDSRSSQAKVEQALAHVAEARANIAQYVAQIAEQQAAIEQAVAGVDGAEAQRRYSEREVDRYAPLAATGAESTEKLSQMTANRDQALATLRQNRASTRQARRKISTLHAQIEIAEAQVLQAEAEARQSEVDVDSSLIRSSIDGRVGDRQVRVGLAAQNGMRLMTIVPVQTVYLVANFKETQIGQMRAGQPASIKVDALGGTEISGTVDSFSPATGAAFAAIPPNNATGNFTKIVQRVPVRILVNAGVEARKILVPGLSVEVSVDTLGSRDALERRRREEEDDADRRAKQREESIERDRKRPASGVGQ